MRRHLILATEPLSAPEEAQLASSLGTPLYWHWLPNFWLLIDYTGTITAETLRDTVQRINPKVQCLALEVDPVTWAAMAKKDAAGNPVTDWVNSNWRPKDGA